MQRRGMPLYESSKACGAGLVYNDFVQNCDSTICGWLTSDDVDNDSVLPTAVCADVTIAALLMNCMK